MCVFCNRLEQNTTLELSVKIQCIIISSSDLLEISPQRLESVRSLYAPSICSSRNHIMTITNTASLSQNGNGTTLNFISRESALIETCLLSHESE